MSQVADLTAQAVDLIAAQLADARRPAITSSFQSECVVLTDLLRQVRPDIPVLFLDTFHHFPQTLAYRDEMTARYGLNLDQPQGRGAESRAMAGREHRRLLRAAQGGAALLVARSL